MLDSIQATNIKDGKIKIAVTGENNILKAFGNITGNKGKNKGPSRDFFGVTDDEIREVTKEYSAANDRTRDRLTSDLTRLVLDRFGVIESDLEDLDFEE